MGGGRGMGAAHGFAMASHGGMTAGPARGRPMFAAGLGVPARSFGAVRRTQGGVFVTTAPFARGFNGGFGRLFSHNRFGRGFGWPYGYGYGGYGGYGWGWPLWDDWSDNSAYNNSDNSGYNNSGYNNNDNDLQTALVQQQQQIDQLENQLQEQRYQAPEQPGIPPRSSVPPSRPSSAQPEPPAGPPTVLVFRDRHRVQADNYAIADNKVYILDPHDRQTVALSDLDIPATVKENEEHGVEFRLPGRT